MEHNRPSRQSGKRFFQHTELVLLLPSFELAIAYRSIIIYSGLRIEASSTSSSTPEINPSLDESQSSPQPDLSSCDPQVSLLNLTY